MVKAVAVTLWLWWRLWSWSWRGISWRGIPPKLFSSHTFYRTCFSKNAI